MPKNYQKLALLNSNLFGTDVLTLIGADLLTLNSAEGQHCRRKKMNFQQSRLSSKIGTNEQPLLRHCSTSHQQCRSTKLPEKVMLSSAPKSSKIGIAE